MLNYFHTPSFYNLDFSQFYTLDSFKISVNEKIKSLWKNDSLSIKLSGEIVKYIVTGENGPNYIKYIFECLHVENINILVKERCIELFCNFYEVNKNYQVDFTFENENVGTFKHKYCMTKNDIRDKNFEFFTDGFFEENQIKKIIASFREDLSK